MISRDTKVSSFHAFFVPSSRNIALNAILAYSDALGMALVEPARRDSMITQTAAFG